VTPSNRPPNPRCQLTKMNTCGLFIIDRQGFISLHHTRHDLPSHVTQRFLSNTVNMPAQALKIGFWFSPDNLLRRIEP
jgi:hypothetical protein